MLPDYVPGESRLLATSPAEEERRRRAAELRRISVPWAEVARQLGYQNASAAAKDVLSALGRERRVTAAHAAGVVQLELNKLDAMEYLLWRIAGKQHITVQNGRVVLDPQSGEVVPDSAPVMMAIDRLVKVQERRAKLLGLDSVSKIDISVTDEMSSRIRELMSELGSPIVEGEVVSEESD